MFLGQPLMKKPDISIRMVTIHRHTIQIQRSIMHIIKALLQIQSTLIAYFPLLETRLIRKKHLPSAMQIAIKREAIMSLLIRTPIVFKTIMAMEWIWIGLLIKMVI